MQALFGHSAWSDGGGGNSTFFQLWVYGPDFRSVRLANWYLPLKRWLVELKISKLGACELKIKFQFGVYELKIFQFGGLRAKIWARIETVEVKFGGGGVNFPIFSKGGLVIWLFCLKLDPCELQERRENGVFRAAHPHTPFLGQCPLGSDMGWGRTRITVCLFVCLTDRSKWKHVDGPERTSLDKMLRHDFKKPIGYNSIACWSKLSCLVLSCLVLV